MAFWSSWTWGPKTMGVFFKLKFLVKKIMIFYNDSSLFVNVNTYKYNTHKTNVLYFEQNMINMIMNDYNGPSIAGLRQHLLNF
jgi:hypothetical protein